MQKNEDLTIFNLIPKMKEFQYSSKIEKLKPLLKNNPVSYETLLDKLLVPQVHVGKITAGEKKEWEECPATCPQKTSCKQIREIFSLIKMICDRLAQSDDRLKDMEIRLIGSMREGTRIFQNDELDVHISVNEKTFKDRTRFDAGSQILYVDGKELDGWHFYTKFLTMLYKIVQEIELPAWFTMKPLSTDFIPCIKCMTIENGSAQAHRCRHKPNCEVHQRCQCQGDCSCKCECQVFTSPSLTRSKIGAALHFGKLSHTNNLIKFYLHILIQYCCRVS